MTNQQPARMPVKRAVLVGVSDYGDPISNLPFCKRDVEEGGFKSEVQHPGFQ